MAASRFFRLFTTSLTCVGLAVVLGVAVVSPASADTVIDGPVDLGTAATYGVLGASTVTNTGPTRVEGDLGLSPGTSLNGFGGPTGGVVTGAIHQTDADAERAQGDAAKAYGVAASLTPTQTGLGELDGLSLTPGVYDGGALALADTGQLTLAGSAESVWVFRAASSLTIGSGTRIVITGGASSCNVFWQVGSSATIGSAAQFQGTIVAEQSITAVTGATVDGRLLAQNGAVTLDTNTITASTGCPPAGSPSDTTAPAITSGTPGAATAGTPYIFTVTATGTPTPTITVTGLSDGLTFDGATGVISGTPTASGDQDLVIIASNGTSPDATQNVTLTIRPAAPGPSSSPSVSVTPTMSPSPSPSASLPVLLPSPSGSARPPVGGLAVTGADATGATLLIAGGLLAAGAIALIAVRRRARRG